MNILIMGLPDSGKTTLSIELKRKLEESNYSVSWYNADIVREAYNDWDFSEEGRVRQAVRMNLLAHNSKSDIVICDFVAPTIITQNVFRSDKFIWMDTIKKSKYKDTNALFQQPLHYDFRIHKKNSKLWSEIIFDNIMGTTNERIEFIGNF
jgi:adenylylsulfate kinase